MIVIQHAHTDTVVVRDEWLVRECPMKCEWCLSDYHCTSTMGLKLSSNKSCSMKCEWCLSTVYLNDGTKVELK